MHIFRVIFLSLTFMLIFSSQPLNGQRISSDFGTRTDPFHGNARKHNGLDIAAAYGSLVYATADGVVTHSGWNGSYGILIKISHINNYETRFAHLSAVAVQKGQRIRKGQIIGKIGSTGRSTGPHLHYEVRRNGTPLNPRNYM